MQKGFSSGKIQNPVDPDKIELVVKKHFRVMKSSLCTPRRKFAFPRQVYVHLLWRYTNLKQREIVQRLGSTKDRTVVPHSVKKIREACKLYDNIRNEVIELEKQIDQ